ncbi:uncharacterized protein METZ01_LOCUS401701 [marine metagenome]|uniref:HTH luxR-type domain-containing protein n=1 Tax=marine metagenome TaxID=408172 RepID=A0A382VQP7_9ZZZZ
MSWSKPFRAFGEIFRETDPFPAIDSAPLLSIMYFEFFRQNPSFPSLLLRKTKMRIEPIWKTWFAKHGAKLFLFARQQARNPADAEDLVQEAFVRIWRLYGHTGDVPPALVFQSIRRLAIDWVRRDERRGIREQKVASYEATDVSWFERSLERRERHALLEEAVRRLPRDQQEVVLLKTWGELTFEEIGKTLDISMNTAASRYRYGLEKLRKWVPEALADEKPIE